MNVPAIVAACAAALFLLLCATRRGFVSPPTGFLVRLSALLAALKPVPREVAARRLKNDADIQIVSAKPRGAIRAQDASIEGPDTAIALRLYRPAESEPDRAILFFHGGGWVLGGIESADALARMLCLESGALVVSADYRLAPESAFPAAVDDALAVYRWLRSEIEDGRLCASRGAAQRIFVSGDSAGGNLAAALCISARDGKLQPPAGQILFYPVVDISRTDRPSYHDFATGFLLDREDMEWFISIYAPDRASRTDCRASPLLAPDHSGLPPALVFTAGFDVLRDEGEAYVEALRRAGVRVEARRMRGLVHGFMSMNRFVPAARRCAAIAGAFVKGAR
ncbi:MAG: alpha/beta hydrolase [Spirochaetaceae bacterium]|nr:alpha/beta hydrolase [Spirochaetaceae bacterium]